MSKQFSATQRIQYTLDAYFSAGTLRLLLSIAIATALVVLGIGITLYLLELGPVSGDDSFIEHMWDALGKTIDPGYAQEQTWSHRIVMLVAALFGILILSTLIGILTTGIESKLNSLRRGKSFVLESNHIVVIGWSSKIFSILTQLSHAYEKKGKFCVVILADMDKVEMEHKIKSQIARLNKQNKGLKFLKTVCRCGEANNLADLEMVNPTNAKSIIIIRDGQNDTDSLNFKTSLALRKVTGGRLPCQLVIEMSDPMNIDAIRHIDTKIHVVNPGDLIARVLVQATREPGLSDVYDEILSFDGEEIYFTKSADTAGQSVVDVINGLQGTTFIGIRKKNGETLLNPDHNLIIKDDDEIITIADNEAPLKFRKNETPAKCSRKLPVQNKEIEHILILGWNHYGSVFLKELQELLHEESTVTIAFDPNLTDSEIPDFVKRRSTKHGNSKNRTFINSLNISTFNHVVVLSYSDKLSHEDADSSSLLTLVHLRDIVDKENLHVNIASEILGVHNKELLDERVNDDFVASEELVSKYLVQLAQSDKIEPILKTLLTASGHEFHMRPTGDYCETNTNLPFSDIVASGIQRNELVVGYRKDGICKLNPDKSRIISFTDSDSIIVLSEQ